jgi:cell wall assembly regulator SMI1
MEELVSRIDRWLKYNRPGYYNYLLPGVSKEYFIQVENQLGVTLPPDFKLFYQWKNGQSYQIKPEDAFLETLIPNYEWLSLEDIIRTTQMMRSSYEADNYWNKNWLPFLSDATASYFCLNLENGQISLEWTDSLNRSVYHSSFYKWLETVVLALEQGIFTGEEEDSISFMGNYTDLVRANNSGYPIKL